MLVSLSAPPPLLLVLFTRGYQKVAFRNFKSVTEQICHNCYTMLAFPNVFIFNFKIICLCPTLAWSANLETLG
jgi:hypothetical protein